MDLEFDRVVQDPIDLRVKLFPQRSCSDGELLVPDPVSALSYQGPARNDDALNVGVHLLLLHVLHRLS